MDFFEKTSVFSKIGEHSISLMASGDMINFRCEPLTKMRWDQKPLHRWPRAQDSRELRGPKIGEYHSSRNTPRQNEDHFCDAASLNK